ncbi:hypothetical protein GQ42DRAFT_36496 [Ramicandelaber brevisporus]|nr:hypothetical protein GQ42DRAFT_36496 [Ramicandelaber brevisporus]
MLPNSTGMQLAAANDATIAQTFCEKLAAKLPLSTGNAGSDEACKDPVTLQLIASIIELSASRFGSVMNSLFRVYDQLGGEPDETAQQHLLGSRLVIIRVIVSCFAYSLKQEAIRKRAARAGMSISELIASEAARQQQQVQQTTSQAGSEAVGMIGDVAFSFHRSGVPIPSVQVESLSDPAPLDEGIAKFIVPRIQAMLQSWRPEQDRSPDAHGAMNASSTAQAMLRMHSSYSTFSAVPSLANAIDLVLQLSPYGMAQFASAQPKMDLRKAIHESAGWVMVFLSASNWPIVYHRTITRLRTLVTFAEEHPDMSDIRQLEFCNMNAYRLATVINDVTAAFAKLRRGAQMTLARILRRCIWNWIELHSQEFRALQASGGRYVSLQQYQQQQQQQQQGQQQQQQGPLFQTDTLFDLCNAAASAAENTSGATRGAPRHSSGLWPLMTMLMVLNPESIPGARSSATAASSSPAGGRRYAPERRAFIEMLLTPRNADRAAVAVSDLLRAASFAVGAEASYPLPGAVSERPSPPAIVQLAGQLEPNVASILFEPLATDPGRADVWLAIVGFASMFRINPSWTLRVALPLMFGDSSTLVQKATIVKTIYKLSCEVPPMTWHPPLGELFPHVAPQMRQLFSESIAYVRRRIKSCSNPAALVAALSQLMQHPAGSPSYTAALIAVATAVGISNPTVSANLNAAGSGQSPRDDGISRRSSLSLERVGAGGRPHTATAAAAAAGAGSGSGSGIGSTAQGSPGAERPERANSQHIHSGGAGTSSAVPAGLDLRAVSVLGYEFFDRIEIVVRLLKLYRNVPSIAIFAENPSDQRDATESLVHALLEAFSTLMPGPIRHVVGQTLVTLHEPRYIRMWSSPAENIRTFWVISSKMLRELAKNMADASLPQHALLRELAILQCLLTQRLAFLRETIEASDPSGSLGDLSLSDNRLNDLVAPIQSSQFIEGFECHERYQAGIALEIALLILLCSGDSGVIQLSLRCISLLCDEATYTEEKDSVSRATLSIVENYQIYRELSSTDAVIMTGKVAQQKRIRKFLRQMHTKTLGNWNAWSEVYNRCERAIRHLRPSSSSTGTTNTAQNAALTGAGAAAGMIGSPVTQPMDEFNNPDSDINQSQQTQQQQQQQIGGRSGRKHGGAGSHGMGGLRTSGTELTSGNRGEIVTSMGGIDSIANQDLDYNNSSGGIGGMMDEDRSGWQNYAGFLCALGGSCLADGGIGSTTTTSTGTEHGGPETSPSLTALQLGPAGTLTTASRSSGGRPGSSSAATMATAMLFNTASPPAFGNSNSSNNSEDSVKVVKFVKEMCSLLVNENELIRSNSKDILGNDLSPVLYPVLFGFLEQRMLAIAGSSDSDSIALTERNTLLVEQAIGVTKLVVDRTNETRDAFEAVNLVGIVLGFVRYLSHMPDTATAIRIRKLLCTLAETMMQRKQQLNLRNEVKLRNRLAEALMTWTSDHPRSATSVASSGMTDPYGLSGVNLTLFGGNNSSNIGELRLQRDLDKDALKALVLLLHQMPLQAPESNTDDPRAVRHQIFQQYFQFFARVLARCRILDTLEDNSINPRIRGQPEFQSLLIRFKEIQRDLLPLKESAINSLSHLLNANVDAGLELTLQMATAEDPKTRTTCMNILTNILNIGTEFAGLEQTVEATRRATFASLLIEQEMHLALAICEVCPVAEIDDIAQSLLTIFEQKNAAMILIEAVVQRELQRTNAAAELFRRNCMATRLLYCYARTYGYDYLRTVLQPLMNDLHSRSHALTFELDPTKLLPGSNEKRNMQNLQTVCNQVLQAILNSSHFMPFQFREICVMLARVVGERFPSSTATAVGGFIFLRFFNPAIVAPDTFGLTSTINNKELRRGLLLTTKVIQNLANDVLFGVKEAFMAPLNEFLMLNQPNVQEFLNSLAIPTPEMTDIDVQKNLIFGNNSNSSNITVGTTPITAASSTTNLGQPQQQQQQQQQQIGTMASSPQQLESVMHDLNRIHRFIVDHQEQIAREFAPRKPSKIANSVSTDVNQSINSNVNSSNNNNINSSSSNNAASQTIERMQRGVKIHEKLTALLPTLGTPPDAPRREPSFGIARNVAASQELYRDFMMRGAHRRTDTLASKKLIYVEGVSKAGRPVVYFIARRLQVDSMDIELAMLHIFRTLEPIMHKQFDLVLDLTQFGHANEVQHQWVMQFVQLMPPQLLSNLGSMYLYNVNTAFRRYTQGLPQTLPPKIAKRTVCPCNISELQNYIAANELMLPPGTKELENEEGVMFSPVQRLLKNNSSHPCIIKITRDAVQVTSIKKQEIWGISAFYNDVYHIADIDSAVLVSSQRHDETLVVLKYDKGNQAITFASPKVELICRYIKSAMSRFQVAQPTPLRAKERLVRPGDVPGLLLNLALYNWGSDDPSLRLAAYNFLYALSTAFEFGIGQALIGLKGLCIPANDHHNIARISALVAARQPRLTLDLLKEGAMQFARAPPQHRRLVLDYMAPWYANLGEFLRPGQPDAAHKMARAREILRILLETTVRDAESYRLAQQCIWRPLSRADGLLDILLDTFEKFAVEKGPTTDPAEIIADTLVTVVDGNPRANKIFVRLRRLLAKTSEQPKHHLSDHPMWLNIATVVRMCLMISFNNTNAAVQFLPEILHSVCLLLGAGPPSIRTSIHGLVTNVIHSLLLAVPMKDSHLQDLHVTLAKLNEPKFRLLFGLNRTATSTTAFALRTPDLTGPGANSGGVLASTANLGVMLQTTVGAGPGGATTAAAAVAAATAASEMGSEPPLRSLETITNTFLEIISHPAFSTEQANAWRARWMSLVCDMAFKYNPILQPRAYVVLGCLSRDEVDDDLLFQIFVSLRNALGDPEDGDGALINSILMCLTAIVERVPRNSQFLPQMFWVGVAIVRINNPLLTENALKLMLATVNALSSLGHFIDEPPATVLLRVREELGPSAEQIDNMLGVSFSSDFGFALAVTLVRALRDNSTHGAAKDVLTALLDIHAKSHRYAHLIPIQPQSAGGTDDAAAAATAAIATHPHLSTLGYLAPLLPTAAKRHELEVMLWQAGFVDPVSSTGQRPLDFLAEALGSPRSGNDPATVYLARVGAYSVGGSGRRGDSLAAAGLDVYTPMLSRLGLTSYNSAVLLASMLAVLLHNAEYEEELNFIYGLLAEIAESQPHIMQLIYDFIRPKLAQSLTTSQVVSIIQPVQRIIITAVGTESTLDSSSSNSSTPGAGAGGGNIAASMSQLSLAGGAQGQQSQSQRLNLGEFLASIRFAGLLECMNPSARSPEQQRIATQYAEIILDSVVQ